MPIRLSNLVKDIRTCQVVFGEEQANLTYRPSAYTPLLEDELQETMQENRPGNALAEMLANVLLSWEVLDDDGEEIRPTAEHLAKFPVGFLAEVVKTISEDLGAGEETRKNSGGGSLSKGS